MNTSRRDFLDLAAAGMAIAFDARPRVGERRRPAGQDTRQLKLLILGGTGFIGPHLVR